MPTPTPPPVAIDLIEALPGSPINGTGFVGIIITNGIPSYFRVLGANLNRIVNVTWYPKNPKSVKFTVRNLILIDSTNTQGTFGVTVTENYLDERDRCGYISFTLDDMTTMVAPVKTYGRLSVWPLWTAPDQGLITG